MKIDRITVRHLKTYGNYENVSVELSAAIQDDEAWGQAFAELNDLVKLKVAQVIEREQSSVHEEHDRRVRNELERDAVQFREELEKMQAWKDENSEFVRLYENMTGRQVPIHYPF